MITRSALILVPSFLFCAAVGCGDSGPSSAAPAADGTSAIAPAPVLPPASALPAPASGAAGSSPGAMPSVTRSTTTAGASAPEVMRPSPAPDAKPSAMPAPGTEPPSDETPKPAADSCEERRVSYAKPCTSDPNPCKIASGFSGDEYCLPAQPADKAIQIHIGPSNYEDQAEIQTYVIQPGEEFNNSVIAHIPESERRFWNRLTVQMRPGSHHWISSLVTGKPEIKFYDDTNCGAVQVGSIGGGQNLIYDNPPGGVPAPENVGLGRELVADTSLCMNLHAYNFTDKPQLREMWINLATVDESEVTQRTSGVGMVGGLGLNVAPGQNKTLTYTGAFSGEGRIIQLFGHRHVWTPRFAVWLNDRLIYDSWSWQESVTFNYDSLSMNPQINTDGKVDGAVSGELPFKAGDVLKFSCFIENTSDHTLRFSNELYGGEMCNLWGSTVGAGIGGRFL